MEVTVPWGGPDLPLKGMSIGNASHQAECIFYFLKNKKGGEISLVDTHADYAEPRSENAETNLS